MKALQVGPKALLTILMGAVPALLLLSFVILHSTEGVLRENAKRQVHDLANKSVQALEALMKRSQKTLLTIAASPPVAESLDALASGSAELQPALARLESAFLEIQKLDPTLQALRVIDEEGNVIVKVREGKIHSGQTANLSRHGVPVITSIRDRDFFKETMALGPGEVWISNLERGRVEGEDDWCPAMVRLSTPLFLPSGERAGMLVVNVWGQAVGDVVKSVISTAEGSAFLVERNLERGERNGIYLFHPDRSCEFGDQSGSKVTAFDHYPKGITDGWMREPEGLRTHPETQDLLAHVFISPYQRSDRGWVVVINANHSFFMAPLATLTTRILAFSGIALLGIILAALYITRLLTRPIRVVIEGTRRLRQDLSSRITVTSGDEFGFLAQEINHMAATLQANLEEKARVEQRIWHAEKLASIGEMAAGLAHELNTPLSNIRALATLSRRELERAEPDRTELKADLGDIAEQTEKCSLIITGLLDFARRQNPELGAHDVNDLVEKSLSLVRLRLETKQVSARFERDESLPAVAADGPQIQQVFVNLLLNAIDAVDTGGSIDVRAERAGDRVRVCIADDGVGIAPEHLSKVFNPFFTTKEVGRGTGLGLSVSYGIVASHGGTIEVESTPGVGSTFTVALEAGGAR